MVAALRSKNRDGIQPIALHASGCKWQSLVCKERFFRIDRRPHPLCSRPGNRAMERRTLHAGKSCERHLNPLAKTRLHLRSLRLRRPLHKENLPLGRQRIRNAKEKPRRPRGRQQNAQAPAQPPPRQYPQRHPTWIRTGRVPGKPRLAYSVRQPAWLSL